MKRLFEPVTAILILICLGFTVYAAVKGPWVLGSWGMTERAWWNGEYWRLLTATFLHAGWLHFTFNALSLFFVGGSVGRALGLPVYLVTLFLGAFAGFGASLFFGPDLPRVGISGGIMGLIGLIVALEWRGAKTIGAFFRARNILLILFFLALSVALGYWVSGGDSRVDHASHIGGGLAGLLAGLWFFGAWVEKGEYLELEQRPARGLIVALLVGLGPLVYHAYPYWNPRFFRMEGRRAARDGDIDQALASFRRVHALLPADVEAGYLLAEFEDDPSYLDGLDLQPGYLLAPYLLRAYLGLAAARFESDPETAARLVKQALRIEPAKPELWFGFAGKASQTGHEALSLMAYEAAFAHALKQRHPDRWRFAYAPLVIRERMLKSSSEPPYRRAVLALRLLVAIREVLPRLQAEPEDRAEFEKMLARQVKLADHIGRLLEAEKDPGAVRAELRATLAWTYNALANNMETDRAHHRFLSAYWWWHEIEGTPQEARLQPDVAARARAALEEAKETGDRTTKTAVRTWLAQRDWPILDEERDGG